MYVLLIPISRTKFSQANHRITQHLTPHPIPVFPNMHPTPLILLALGAVALAHPTTDATDAPLLQKRSSRPWIDSYAPDDASCKVGDFATSVYGRPFIQAGDCVPWSPYQMRVGGSWGAGAYGLKSFWAFENDDCTGPVKAEIGRKGGEHGFCFNLHTLGCRNGDVDNPCYWQSVRGNK